MTGERPDATGESLRPAAARSPWAFVPAVLRHNAMCALAYRGSFLAQVVFMMLNNLMFVAFWWLVFDRFPDLDGWRMADTMVLFAVVCTSFGLAFAIAGNALRLSSIIQEGQLDYYLTMPPDPLAHALITRMHLSAVGDILFGLLLAARFMPCDAHHWLLFALLVPISSCVLISFAVIAGSMAFFLGSSEGLSRFMFEALVTFSMYPETLFQGWAKWLLFTLIPAGFVGFLPASLLTRFSFAHLAWLALGALVFALLARAVFRFGLSRYESGNLIAMRG